MHKLFCTLCIFTFIATFSANAQDQTKTSEEKKVSNGYKEYKLGMHRDDVKKKLKYSAEFAPERIEAIQTRLEPDSHILTAEGVNPINGLIRIGYFYFDDDNHLEQITIQLNENKISYYSVLKRFIEKFDNPVKFDPNRAIWSDNENSVILEKPCIIKYKKNNFEESSRNNPEILYNKIRQEFIDQL